MQGNSKRYACLILAAGSSKRMGKAKLLLKYKDESLILRCLSTVLSCISAKDTFIVTGAYKERMEKALAPFANSLHIIYNERHLEGMGSSIACGVATIKEHEYDGLLLVLPDQILLEAKNLEEIIALHKKHPAAIILSNYGKSKGPPSVFPPEYFLHLSELQGDRGAKYGMTDKYELVTYDFPFGMYDIDKMDDCKEFDISD